MMRMPSRTNELSSAIMIDIRSTIPPFDFHHTVNYKAAESSMTPLLSIREEADLGATYPLYSL